MSWVTVELAKALAPLHDALDNGTTFSAALHRLGWRVELNDEQMGMVHAVLPVLDALETIGQTLGGVSADEPLPGDQVASLITATSDILQAIDTLRNVDIAVLTELPSPLDDPSSWHELALDLPEYLLIAYLRSEAAPIYGMLRTTGVIVDVEDPRGPNDRREQLIWDHLLELISDPAQRLWSAFQWGGEFDYARLFTAIKRSARALRIPANYTSVRAPLRPLLVGGGRPSVVFPELDLTLVSATTADNSAAMEAGLLIVPIPPEGAPIRRPEGVYFGTWAWGGVGEGIDLGDGWSLTVRQGLDLAGQFGFAIRPTGAAFISAEPFTAGKLSVERRPVSPWIVFGDPDGVRLELSGATIAIGVEGQASAPEFFMELGTLDQGLSFVVQPGEADGFVNSVLGAAAFSANLDIQVRWSSQSGLTIAGGGGLDLTLPVDLSLGGFTLQELHVHLRAENQALVGVGAVVASATLGPFSIAVDGLGVILEIGQAQNDTGTFGKLDLGFALRPPDGIGIGVDVEVASGGGFLDIDAEAGSYDGVLDLELLGVGISAVAIIDTRLPDVDGWSMFLALFLDLPSIQLGFGFTLEGVGGVAGVNRAIDTDALGSAVRSGSLDAILFPDDPIADAPMIIDAFRAIFPAADDSYVFGPIVKIGWGTPSIIEAELGIVIQLPDPLVIVVLGSLSALLPREDLELIALNLNVAGVIDFEAGTLSLDASLHDSHVVGFALSGDMALRAEFANAQAFLMAVGGFHPRFDPPGDFPDLRRVSFGISAGSLLRIDFQSYFALTSNSVQCGASFVLDADVAGFGVYGSSSFDALVQFSPFVVLTSVDFEVSIKAAGIDLMGVMLHASVEGPNRWHVIGTATFEVLGLEKDIRVDELIGPKEKEPSVQAPDLLGDLIAALSSADAWQVVAGNDAAVTLSDIPDSDAGLSATPESLIEVRQTLVPLDLELEQFGNAPIGDHRSFDLASRNGEASGWLDDWFAPAYFFELSKADKLEGPEFEKMRSGLQFGGGPPATGQPVSVDTGHQAFVLDPELPEAEVTFLHTVVLDGTAGVPLATDKLGGYTALLKDTVATVEPTYALVDESGQTVRQFPTWSSAYATGNGRTGLHIERQWGEVAS